MPKTNKSEKVACKNCGAKVSKNNIARHLKQFHKHDHFACTSCRFNTSTKELLDQHISQKHGKVGKTDKFSCTKCTTTFPSYYALMQHRRVLHGDSGILKQQASHSSKNSK